MIWQGVSLRRPSWVAIINYCDHAKRADMSKSVTTGVSDGNILIDIRPSNNGVQEIETIVDQFFRETDWSRVNVLSDKPAAPTLLRRLVLIMVHNRSSFESFSWRKTWGMLQIYYEGSEFGWPMCLTRKSIAISARLMIRTKIDDADTVHLLYGTTSGTYR